MNSPPRYSCPIRCARPRGARLIEAFSVKLNRRVTMFSRAQFEAWLAIEVDPRVTAYCERPAMFRRKEQNIAPDFWRCDEAGESFICIGEDDWPDTGYRLADEAATLWSAFVQIHHRQAFADELQIPMESFTRAVEIVLKESLPRDAPDYRPPLALWESAVRHCGYVQSRQAVSDVLPRLPVAA